MYVRPYRGSERPPKITPESWRRFTQSEREELIERYLKSLREHTPWEPLPAGVQGSPGAGPVGAVVSYS
eukprot:9310316-Alexandrium_andersonii.AAC.1